MLSYTQTNESHTMEDMIRDLMILDRLKKEEEENYNRILSGIRRRRIVRLFAGAGVAACAAAVLLAVVLHRTSGMNETMPYSVNLPTLITDAGESITLEDCNSYTLEFEESVDYKGHASPMTEILPEKGTATGESQAEDLSAGKLHEAAAIAVNTVVIPQGYTYNIRFDDGTEAYINSGSYIEFPKSFAGKSERRVAITGEAYFKVAKSEKPFIVSAEGIEIKVYGTEFNVNTNRTGRIETVLVSGSVGIRKEGDTEEVMMMPDQMLTYDTEQGTVMTKTIDPSEYLSWMRGDFTYNDRPLSELLEEISSFYNIEIEKDRHFKDQTVTISLSRKLGHRQMMEILEQALELEFTNTGKRSYKCKTNYY